MTAKAAIILAAGQGTRMKSSLPKVMHPIGGRPMVDWSIALAETIGCEKIIVVTSPAGKQVQDHVREKLGEAAIAVQDPPQGTGHAVRCAESALAGFSGDIVVLYGDTPLIPQSAVQALFEAVETSAGVGVLGFRAADPGAYGRLIQNESGGLEAIVEAKDATSDQLKIDLCNSGVLSAPAVKLFDWLSKVKNENAKGEYYLTDVVALARADGADCAVVECDEADVMGVNSRVELAVAETAFQTRRRSELLDEGVTMTDPASVYFCHDTHIENDVLIEPNVVFGPGVSVQTGAVIRAFSHLEGAVVGSGSVVGPYARLRPGAVLGQGVKVGNFVEVKNVEMADGAKANHLSYLGDGSVGANANIGAGTIFCNYDGFLKYRTEVGEGAFVGSNSALVAPVKIGDGAMIGSGSVITKDVDAGALAVARGRQMQKTDWAKAFRERMSAIKAAKKKG